MEGKYAGPDKYKGIAPKGGKWKGKYIGPDRLKGEARKPSGTSPNLEKMPMIGKNRKLPGFSANLEKMPKMVNKYKEAAARRAAS